MEASKAQLPRLTEEAIRAYYKLDFQPMLDAISPDCLFIGAASDIYRGLAEMLDDMDNIKNVPTFSMCNQKFELVDTQCPDQAIVFGEYDMESDFGFDMIIAVHQRITVSLRRNGSSWEMYCVHSSNEWNEPDAGEIFPTFVSKQTFRHLKKIMRASAESLESRKRVSFSVDGATMPINPDVILYAESAGKKSVLHLADRKITVNAMLNNVANALPPGFIRTHRYYLVNTAHVERIEHHRITLSNDDELPIPERRAKEVREALIAAMKNEGNADSLLIHRDKPNSP